MTKTRDADRLRGLREILAALETGIAANEATIATLDGEIHRHQIAIGHFDEILATVGHLDPAQASVRREVEAALEQAEHDRHPLHYSAMPLRTEAARQRRTLATWEPTESEVSA